MEHLVLGVSVLFLLALCVGLTAIHYRRKLRRYRSMLSREDLCLLKIARDNLNAIWQEHDPGGNLVLLDHWRKRRDKEIELG